MHVPSQRTNPAVGQATPPDDTLPDDVPPLVPEDPPELVLLVVPLEPPLVDEDEDAPPDDDEAWPPEDWFPPDAPPVELACPDDVELAWPDDVELACPDDEVPARFTHAPSLQRKPEVQSPSDSHLSLVPVLFCGHAATETTAANARAW